MKHLFLLFAMLVGFGAQAQSDFAPIGAQWYYDYCDGMEPISDPTYYNLYEAVGDTQISGEQMRVIIGKRWNKHTGQLDPMDTVCLSSSPDTVFYYHTILRKKVPLFIFNVQVGDTMTFYTPTTSLIYGSRAIRTGNL